ncbi:MBL fold metallo-hydrolase [Arcanobacterium phocisimile]|uniref:MBL fold metallo-hydrolase n=1 Tax=Arcanobacterium phocisimile TaxID=1302235 RepID=A0ABX7IF56_9ACTO|nr:MBL fold metallo-hydrolase [Arcanobacterium phocisimile]QRV01592.1 MBL fold metallo-hydrolase [Arcanobacterium phocisimile]
MKLTIIGCSGSMSGKDSPASSYLIQATGKDETGFERLFSIVCDFGPGAMGHLMRYADPAMVDAMFLSHFHADHCADMVGMQVYRRWYPEGALPQIPVYSPGDGAARTRGLSADDPAETYETEFDFQQLVPGSLVRVGPLTVEAFAANHTVPTLSLRISGPSEEPDLDREVVLTYTGDTDTVASVVEAERNADLVLSEAAFEEGRDTVRGVHLTGLRAGQMAAEAGAARLVLTHLQPWTNAEKNLADARSVFTGEVHVAQAGAVFTI